MFVTEFNNKFFIYEKKDYIRNILKKIDNDLGLNTPLKDYENYFNFFKELIKNHKNYENYFINVTMNNFKVVLNEYENGYELQYYNGLVWNPISWIKCCNRKKKYIVVNND